MEDETWLEDHLINGTSFSTFQSNALIQATRSDTRSYAGGGLCTHTHQDVYVLLDKTRFWQKEPKWFEKYFEPRSAQMETIADIPF